MQAEEVETEETEPTPGKNAPSPLYSSRPADDSTTYKNSSSKKGLYSDTIVFYHSESHGWFSAKVTSAQKLNDLYHYTLDNWQPVLGHGRLFVKNRDNIESHIDQAHPLCLSRMKHATINDAAAQHKIGFPTNITIVKKSGRAQLIKGLPKFEFHGAGSDAVEDEESLRRDAMEDEKSL
jgi:hypothetical protein